MATTTPQQTAATIYTLGRQAGLPPNRALELVATADAESSLNPAAVNKQSGAAGPFQLLSSGYVQRAKQLGGVFNVTANTRAILPDYVNYWRQNPTAAPGEAGAAVERSGMGAGFYARPLGRVRSLVPAGGGAGGSWVDALTGATPAAPAAAPKPAGGSWVDALAGTAQPAAQPSQPPRAPRARPAAPASRPTGSWVDALTSPTASQSAFAAGGLTTPAAPATFKPLNGAVPMVTGGRSPYKNLTFAGHTDWQHVNPTLLSRISQALAQRGLTGQVISGYRSNDYSAANGGFRGDPHTKGVAVDVYVNGQPIGKVIPATAWQKLGIRSGDTFTYHGAPDYEHLDLIGYGY